MTSRATLVLTCVVTAVHYTGAYMRVPVLPLYARAHGASTAEVGVIVGAQMAAAAFTAIPFGRASDRWGRAPLLLAGIALSALTSVALAAVTTPWALAVVYGAAGVGLSAFTPTVMSLVGDVAAPGAVARAYGWYTTALYAGFGLGPILGGLAAERAGERATFLFAAGVVALALGAAWGLRRIPVAPRPSRGGLAAVLGNRTVVAGWVATLAGLGTWGAIVTFFPLMARDRGLGPSAIGLVLGAQAFVNTLIRVPAGWALDRTRARRGYVLGGMLVGAGLTAAFPLAHEVSGFLLLAAAHGIALGVAFVALGAALSEATTPATRGAAMGGYSTAIYAGFGAAAFALGPIVGAWGYGVGFALAGFCAAATAVGAAVLWRQARPAPTG